MTRTEIENKFMARSAVLAAIAIQYAHDNMGTGAMRTSAELALQDAKACYASGRNSSAIGRCIDSIKYGHGVMSKHYDEVCKLHTQYQNARNLMNAQLRAIAPKDVEGPDEWATIVEANRDCY